MISWNMNWQQLKMKIGELNDRHIRLEVNFSVQQIVLYSQIYSRIYLSRIYSLIFKSKIDSYSYLPQFHFMKIIPICEYCNCGIIFLFTNIFQSVHEYLILIRNIYREWVYISLHFSLPGKFFKGKIYKSQEKKIIRKKWKKIYFRYLWINRKYFPNEKYYSYSYSKVLGFTNFSYSYSYRSWLHESIPIPICGKNNYSLITGKFVFLFWKIQQNLYEWVGLVTRFH